MVLNICNICKKISATDGDHLDCIQMRRIKLEDEEFKNSIAEKMDISNSKELGVEIRAILEHLSREKSDRASKGTAI